MIEHRKYLLSYGEPWTYGYFKNIIENPPCKKPDSPKNKQYDYELELIKESKTELYLHVIGETGELNEIEKQLSKYKIARFVNENSLVILIDEMMALHASYHQIQEYCREKGFAIIGRQVLK